MADSESDYSENGNFKTCPYCLASIPKAAVKCSHCHEWVDKKGSDLKGTIGDATITSAFKTGIQEIILILRNFDFL
ncbi:zinc ribbon domain-containing protein [Methanobacterium formicicum]|jgi:ribosomal protein L40E|uniref:Zinc ribbon domain-containing protein n=1 Tax=Methanobacterium formicicum TaxID=2162 RepID=A0A089ZID0_METFO|nr:zinc ribbon domain-containing protein [Methanobacterium formicicum]AIS32373.1 hypothetical protein BRM9_1559 [Methanobacterium formicicum]MBF4473950.1 zinc ribbon domain-containing protein [Methanobacterium formicicum]CEL24395.1 hypothetical protein MB9_0752 [Methanobacterium formicicum]